MKENIKTRLLYLRNACKLAKLLAVHFVIKHSAQENLRGYALNFVISGLRHAKMNGLIHTSLILLR